MVWNEINNIKIGAEKLDISIKQNMFEILFKKKKHVKYKDIIEFLKSEGIEFNQNQLSGIDITIKSSLSSYLDFKKIFGADIEKYQIQQMVEEIICWLTVYGDETKMLKRIIRQHYPQNVIRDEQLKKIIRLHYQGWGRLSKELLNGIEGADTETGEVYTIISALRNTNDNLMQILSRKYTFIDEIEAENSQNRKEIHAFTYENLIGELPASPAVKRAAWQTVMIAKEIGKIMDRAPEKIFIETTRSESEKKRTISRKDSLLELYKHIKTDEKNWVEDIKQTDEKDFRSMKLFLYYTQMGRCMYTGDPIDLSNLYDTSVYNRDHIYPQSKTKDDSIDNLVLVKSSVNAKKSNEMLSENIQTKMQPFLVRKTPLTNEELAGFINRQIVETSQSAKIVAEIIQEIFCDAKIIYVKAKAVSEFRQERLDMVKVRSLNDFHHAKDAYLNIVVGNVYYEKFTNNPLQWLRKTRDREYNLNRLYDFDLIKNNKIVWKRGKEGSIKTISQQMRKNNIQYTRYAITNKTGQSGGFFDQNPIGKDQNPSVPLKKGMDVHKYGGYNKVATAYVALVESEDKKKNLIRSLEAVPVYMKNQFEAGKESFEAYCEQVYGLKNPRVIISCIKKDSCLVIDKFPMHLRGTTGQQLTFQGAVQLCLDEGHEKYLKKIEKYIQRNQENKNKDLLKISEKEGLTKEKNLCLYMELGRKLEGSIYKDRPNNQYGMLMKAKEKFEKLTPEEQCIVINEILWLFRCKTNASDLRLLGGSKNTGMIKRNKIISSYTSVKLKNQSVTGLFEQTVDLLKV